MRFLFTSFLLFSVYACLAQAPNLMTYQAVVRDASGNIASNRNITLKLGIFQGSASGILVYEEYHTTTTNVNGLATVVVGQGTILTGTIAGINWANGPYFFRTECDVNGGFSFTLSGTTQIVSVPYAMYAQYAANGPAGATGPQGPAGATGPQGPQGPQGINGALVKTTVEAAGVNCATGGFKLEFGQDANNNGTLDASEINASLTRYVCNGAAGPQGPAGATGPQGIQGVAGTQGPQGVNGALVKTSTEPSGTNCTTGGIKLEFGQDANNNGVLDASEINASLTRYVCNGATGAAGATGATGPAGATGSAGPAGPAGPSGTNGRNTLIKRTPVSAGVNCQFGGTKLEFGLDNNSNNVLDASEINNSLTTYVCNGFNSNNQWYVGKDTLGGIVYFVYQGSDGLPHGLIVSKTETSLSWSSPSSLVGANSSFNGVFNTNLMTNSLSKTWVQNLGAGWYLPSIDELKILLDARFLVNSALQNSSSTLIPNTGFYWSSTEATAANGFRLNVLTGATVSTSKSTASLIRGVRSF